MSYLKKFAQQFLSEERVAECVRYNETDGGKSSDRPYKRDDDRMQITAVNLLCEGATDAEVQREWQRHAERAGVANARNSGWWNGKTWVEHMGAHVNREVDKVPSPDK